jgi:hypothetical protein
VNSLTLTVVSTLASIAVGGVITWWVAQRVYEKQDARTEQIFVEMVKMIQHIVPVLKSGGTVDHKIGYDERGRISYVGLTVYQSVANLSTAGLSAAGGGHITPATAGLDAAVLTNEGLSVRRAMDSQSVPPTDTRNSTEPHGQVGS